MMTDARFLRGPAALLFLAGSLAAQPDTGTIAGTVTLRGPGPSPRFLERRDPDGCPEGPLVDQSRLVTTGGRVPWAFLWIAKGKLPPSAKAPDVPVELRIASCQFVPHVVGIQKGQALVLRNEDAMDHAIQAGTPGGSILQDVLEAHGGRKETRPGEVSLLTRVTSSEHPWMRSTLWVLDHPYFDVTDGEGNFRIENVPPGLYAVAIGHESFHGLGRLVEVKAGESSRLDFVMTDPAAPPPP